MIIEYKKTTNAFILIFLTVTVLFLTSCGKSDAAMDAWIYAKHEVELQLKAPKTAEFCSYTQAEITERGNNQYTVTGYVDAENSFGAMLRTDFTVKLTLTQSGYKDAECYFGDDSLFAIAEDVAEEHGYLEQDDEPQVTEEKSAEKDPIELAKKAIDGDDYETAIHILREEEPSDEVTNLLNQAITTQVNRYFRKVKFEEAMSFLEDLAEDSETASALAVELSEVYEQYSYWLGIWTHDPEKGKYDYDMDLAFYPVYSYEKLKMVVKEDFREVDLEEIDSDHVVFLDKPGGKYYVVIKISENEAGKVFTSDINDIDGKAQTQYFRSDIEMP